MLIIIFIVLVFWLCFAILADPSISKADASRLCKVINYHKLGSET
jgi:hypothetical protein